MPALHIGQQHVLLRFVKAMDLVDKQNRAHAAFASRFAAVAMTRRISATVLSTPLSRSKRDCVDWAMICASVVFPVARRPENDDRRNPIGPRSRGGGAFPGPRMCSWPTYSASDCGRMR
jgi:hypothetical protein